MLVEFCLALTTFLAGVVSSSPIESRQQQDGKFTFYNLKTPASGPCDLAAGPDGALWGEDILVNKLFRIDPSSGNVEEYDIPFTTPLSNATIPGVSQLIQDRTAFSCAIRSGADGNLYFSNGLRNQLGRINPKTKAIQILQPPINPLGNLQPFNDLYTSPTGIYFTQTSGNTFMFFSFATQTFTTYTVPTPASFPLGLYVASDGLVYIAELIGNEILVFNPKTLMMQEYPLPEPLLAPAVVRAEKNGYVYSSLFLGNGIGRINMKTHKIDIFHTNQLGGLGAEDTIDKDGGVWLSFFNVDAMARLDTKTLTYSYVPFPGTFAATTGANVQLGDVPPYVDIAVNYGPGNAIWFTSILGNQVGRYSLS